MRRAIVFILLAMLAAFNIQAKDNPLSFDFYGNAISVANDLNAPEYDGVIRRGCGQLFYEEMELGRCETLVNSLMAARTSLKLNDWMYFLLVRNTAQRMFSSKDANYRTMFCWYILKKSGYNTILLENSEKAWVFVRSDEHVFDMPYVENAFGRYVNISYFFDKDKANMSMLNCGTENDGASGKTFQFGFTSLPSAIRPQIVEKQLKFSSGEENYTVNLRLDAAAASYEKNYPDLDLTDYDRMPLSSEAYSSLIPQFRQILAGKTTDEAVRILLSFTRTAFEYKTDEEAYGKENLMFSPEETLYYPYSDCEDRAILFTYLARTLLGLKTIYLAYPNHVMVAVQLAHPRGSVISKEGINYTVCEPTGPQDVLEIGEIPTRYQTASFTVNP
jgi:hypothetical protein